MGVATYDCTHKGTVPVPHRCNHHCTMRHVLRILSGITAQTSRTNASTADDSYASDVRGVACAGGAWPGWALPALLPLRLIMLLILALYCPFCLGDGQCWGPRFLPLLGRLQVPQPQPRHGLVLLDRSHHHLPLVFGTLQRDIGIPTTLAAPTSRAPRRKHTRGDTRKGQPHAGNMAASKWPWRVVNLTVVVSQMRLKCAIFICFAAARVADVVPEDKDHRWYTGTPLRLHNRHRSVSSNGGCGRKQ